MPLELFQSTLETGAAMFTGAAVFLLDIQWIEENFPKVHDALQHFCETDPGEKRKIVFLTALYTCIALTLWYCLREKPQKRKLRLR